MLARMDGVLDLTLAREMRAARGTTRPLERGAAQRELVRIAPGAYVSRDAWLQAAQEERHRTIAQAVRARASVPPVFSHESAAAFHSIPIVGEWPDWATVTVRRGGGESSAAVERVHRSLAPEDVTARADGLRLTTVERTLIDLAATRSTLSAIVAISHARHEGVTLDRIVASIARAGRMPGIRAVRAALLQSTDRAESPLETLVLVRCRDLGFAEPELQREIRGTDGVRYRVDFAWRNGAIVLEADGKLKYRSEPGRPTPGEVLWAEKRREDAIRGRGPTFVRASWDDAWHGDGLEQLLVAAGVPRVRMPNRSLTR